MPKEETAYKTRIASFLKKLAFDTNFPYWATALGQGASSGVPDKWFQFGHI